MRPRERAVPLALALLCGVLAIVPPGYGVNLPRLAPGVARGASLVLVTLDTTRADRLGAYGAAGAETPAFDALAHAGWLFERAFTVAPVTLPAHASLLTGLYPPAHGVRHNAEFRLTGAVPTLAGQLRAAGYATAAFVSSFVLDARFGLGRGFDVYDAALAGDGGPAFPSGILERRGVATVEAALAWLVRQPADRPVFLWVHLFDAHAPYEPPEPWRSRFAGRPYEGEIAAADAALGRLLAATAGRRPLVVVAGDHGEGLGDHGERTHGIFLYDETARVPLAIRLPKAAGVAPARIDELVSLVDLAPSLLHLLGIPDAARRDGRNRFTGAAGAAEDAVYLEALMPWIDYGWAPLTAVRTRDAKLIRAPRPEYYRLAEDPGERHNRAADPAARGEVGRLVRRLVAFGDPMQSLATGEAGDGVEPEAREALQALGYLGGAGPAPGEAPADPKDKIAIANALIDAHAAMQAGRLDAALASLGELERSEPRDRSVLQALGKVYLRLGRRRDAERVLLAFTAVRPKSDVSLLLGQLALLDGRYAECRRHLDEATRLEPEHGGIEIARGDLAARLGDREAAAAHYRRAAEIDPGRAAGAAAARLAALAPAAQAP
jgi:arylsulfatase A-like enzyme